MTNPIPLSRELAELSLYERQLNFVESMVEFHPEFLEMFDVEELRIFRTYFIPDWDEVADYREYYQQVIAENVGIRQNAHALLERYISAHHVESPQSLLNP